MAPKLLTGVALVAALATVSASSFAAVSRHASIEDLATTEPVVTTIDGAPGQGILPLAAVVALGLVVVGAAAGFSYYEYQAHHAGCLTASTPWGVAGDVVFDVAKEASR